MIKQRLVEKPNSEIPVGNATSLRSIVEPWLEPSTRTTENVYVVILGGNGIHLRSGSPSSHQPALGSDVAREVRIPQPAYSWPDRLKAAAKGGGVYSVAS